MLRDNKSATNRSAKACSGLANASSPSGRFAEADNHSAQLQIPCGEVTKKIALIQYAYGGFLAEFRFDGEFAFAWISSTASARAPLHQVSPERWSWDRTAAFCILRLV